jgi:RNA-directed DNA polymerase
VPTSGPAITAFRHHVIERWLRAIRRRGQKHRLTWRRVGWRSGAVMYSAC